MGKMVDIFGVNYQQIQYLGSNFSTKLYEDEKREKERAIAELNQVKKLYGQVIDTNKQLREQIQLLDRNINVYKNKLSGFEAKLRVTEQENTEIKSSFWYKLFGKKVNKG